MTQENGSADEAARIGAADGQWGGALAGSPRFRMRAAPKGSILETGLTLALSVDGQMLGMVPIDRRRLTLGRRPYNDVLLDDLTVSGEHALIQTHEGAAVIHDLNSRNGTLVNGSPVMQHLLGESDVVELGVYRFEFRSVALESSASGLVETGSGAAGSRNEGIWLPTDAQFPSGRRPAQAAVSAPDVMQSSCPPAGTHVVYLSGVDAGRVRDLDRAVTSIQNEAGQIAVIAHRAGRFWLTHVEGVALPLINGESIGLGGHALGDGDLIELSGTILQLRLRR